MPGTPGPRRSDGAPHASDVPAYADRDTPYDRAVGQPMTCRGVGSDPYLETVNQMGEQR